MLECPEGVAKVLKSTHKLASSTSANYGGTGLGLPISKRFAEMMGGDVNVSSEEGVGSVFSIAVPRECPEINDEIEEGVINLDSTENVVVLVDDDAAMHGLIKRTIAKLNLTLIGATNGEKRYGLNKRDKTKTNIIRCAYAWKRWVVNSQRVQTRYRAQRYTSYYD